MPTISATSRCAVPPRSRPATQRTRRRRWKSSASGRSSCSRPKCSASRREGARPSARAMGWSAPIWSGT
ncbi:hypothetical protein E6C76_20215 [Pseudothauera nasutitermitis]|uniref:Uncharacterized protein n=1 Tax=Pseudothauera nasutitermitis TaxID=2565930 RepID=A0A4S4AP19_9RHOO|nr:hypothetical protein E6C76_20215 [Pseudothauera nasutitermitis]